MFKAVWFAPVVILTGLLAVIGLKWGQSFADMDESAIITQFARQYLDEVPGADAGDCEGRPGVGRAWVVVSCGPEPFDAERHRTYRIDRLGRLIGTGVGGI